MIEMTDLEQDALMEIFNVGVGYAADSFSQMVREEVKLSVPLLKIIPREELHREFAGNAHSSFCGVMQHFEGELQAQAILMFPGENSLELVRMMLGEMVALEEMTDLEQEALTEVGNVLLNSCASAISDTLGGGFSCSLPYYVSGAPEDILPETEGQEYLLMLNIDFNIERRSIRGYLVFLMRVESIAQIKQAVMNYLNRFL